MLQSNYQARGYTIMEDTKKIWYVNFSAAGESVAGGSLFFNFNLN